MRRLQNKSILLIVLAVWLFMVIYRADQTPGLWFDEGWTLSVARNWVDLGMYARLLDGQPVSAIPMVHSIFVTAPVALSFSIFGIGAWQARLAGALYSLGSLLLLYQFSKRLYGHQVAGATLLIILFLSAYPLHPILMGRQALAETPMLFFLLLGYWFFWKALEQPLPNLLLAMVFWGIALVIKKQPLPFWSLSLVMPCILAVYRRKWSLSLIFVIGWVGSFIFYLLFNQIEHIMAGEFPLYGSSLEGLLESSAWVLLLSKRLLVVKNLLLFAPLFLIGQVFILVKYIHPRNWIRVDELHSFIMLSYLSLTISWLGWYLCLSVGWSRYLFPVIFLGSVHVALLIASLTDQFNLRGTITTAILGLKRIDLRRSGLIKFFFIILLIYSLTINALFVQYSYSSANNAVFKTVDYINNSTPSDTLVETYDSELFFLLERRYHYPPDQTHVDLNRRLFLEQNIVVNYDPLAADPDYIIVGPQSKMWGLYESLLITDKFQLVFTAPKYEIYQRVP
jgi:4-amino-4-deoxy-L-arabinose transferase-like glycosyltransferase